MIDANTRQAAAERHQLPVRNLIAASAGNAVEWFDWTIFALFSTFFATQFFPAGNPTLAYLNTAATFALAFFFRPLGGWLLGKFADRRGRKPALLLTTALMCGGSLVIALAPTFETVGWLAPILLLAARIAQGMSLGGEVSNASAYLGEIAPPRNGAELRGIERIERHVDAGDAAFGEHAGVKGELAAIRGER